MSSLTQILQPYRGCKIAVYGLSVLTKEALPIAGLECQVVGLLDGYRTEGELYGKPIISLEKAVQEGVALILVLARPESCKIIAKRIGNVCREHKVELLDIRGKSLLAPKAGVYDLKGLRGFKKQSLLENISRHDIVSVDFFDTLVMRQTLFPTDVFELVDFRLRKQGICIEGFSKKRLEAEKELCKQTIPTLFEIYIYMENKYGISGISAEELAELEWRVDRDLLIPRKEFCSLMQDIYRQGKPVYIVTDTFYTREQIARLLSQCGIACYTDILTSCNYRTSKTQQLFQRLREKIPSKSCIHIGDSEDADVKAAEANGLAGWRIYSGLDLFEQAGYLGMWDAIGGLSSRVQAGMFVSRLFNSPFQFEAAAAEITVHSASDIGFLFFAPIITSFVFWFYQQVQENGLKNVWFCARDGYLIQELYDLLDGSHSSVYFLTSRTAAIRAGVETREDIQYVEEMRFSGRLEEQLKVRFGIEIEAPDTKTQLLDYEQELLKKAADSRKNYLVYLDGLEIVEGPIAFFDFVARGTTQMYISRLVRQPLKGFYFMQQDPEYMRKNRLDILPFYRKEEAAKSAIAENYYILETVLTSPVPSLIEFDREGKALYTEESRTEEHLQCIQKIQGGIRDYFHTYLKLLPEKTESRVIGELCLSLIHNIAIHAPCFLDLTVEDPFFNRTTDLADIL